MNPWRKVINRLYGANLLRKVRSSEQQRRESFLPSWWSWTGHFLKNVFNNKRNWSLSASKTSTDYGRIINNSSNYVCVETFRFVYRKTGHSLDCTHHQTTHRETRLAFGWSGISASRCNNKNYKRKQNSLSVDRSHRFHLSSPDTALYSAQESYPAEALKITKRGKGEQVAFHQMAKFVQWTAISLRPQDEPINDSHISIGVKSNTYMSKRYGVRTCKCKNCCT